MKAHAFFILLAVILSTSSGSAATETTELSLSSAVENMAADAPTIVILGEDHRNRNLARAVTGLTKALADKQNLNCVFLELPRDSQESLTSAIDKGDIKAAALAFLEPKLVPTLAAYEKLGKIEITIEEIKKFWFSNPVAALATFPIDQGFLNLVKSRKIQVIAFDSNSDSSETAESIYFSIARQAEPDSKELFIGAIPAFDARSKIMSENIRESMKTRNCTSALVVVGYAHLYDSSVINTPVGTNFSLSPLQVLLDREGLDSKVLIADVSAVSNDAKAATISFDSDERFANYVGRLLSPP